MTALAAPLGMIAALLTVVAPPAGRPPEGPLQRVEPRIYDVAFDVQLMTTLYPNEGYRPSFSLRNTPIVMPVIFQSTFSRVDPDSLRAQLWYESEEDRTVGQRNRLDGGHPFGTQLAVITVPSFEGQALRWRLAYRTQVWSSQIDDAAAARVTWPREWPEEVRDGLRPQLYIESDHPVFAQTVEKVSGGRLRLVPPWLAAKDLVRYAINELQIFGDGEDRREFKFLHGLEVQGAVATAQSGRGGPHDLVCVCVAMLRAAGIPARAVIGIEEDVQGVVHFVSWAELYLPDVGWVPFDPDEMRGKGIRSRDVRQPWPEFGTMDELNERIPLAFHFMPPVAVQTPQAPAVWGWSPQPGRPPSHEQFINLQIVSRGRGTPGPTSQPAGR